MVVDKLVSKYFYLRRNVLLWSPAWVQRKWKFEPQIMNESCFKIQRFPSLNKSFNLSLVLDENFVKTRSSVEWFYNPTEKHLFFESLGSSGSSTAVEYTSHDIEVVGSNPAGFWGFSSLLYTISAVFLIRSFIKGATRMIFILKYAAWGTVNYSHRLRKKIFTSNQKLHDSGFEICSQVLPDKSFCTFRFVLARGLLFRWQGCCRYLGDFVSSTVRYLNKLEAVIMRVSQNNCCWLKNSEIEKNDQLV